MLTMWVLFSGLLGKTRVVNAGTAGVLACLLRKGHLEAKQAGEDACAYLLNGNGCLGPPRFTGNCIDVHGS